MYRYLSAEGRVVVPLICALAFLYFYFKYRKDEIVPVIGAYGNIAVCIGCILLCCNELLKQNILEIKFNLHPFIVLDFCNLFLVLGAIMFLIAASKHEKYKNKLVFRYVSTAYLLLLSALYVFARVMYWR